MILCITPRGGQRHFIPVTGDSELRGAAAETRSWPSCAAGLGPARLWPNQYNQYPRRTASPIPTRSALPEVQPARTRTAATAIPPPRNTYHLSATVRLCSQLWIQHCLPITTTATASIRHACRIRTPGQPVPEQSLPCGGGRRPAADAGPSWLQAVQTVTPHFGRKLVPVPACRSKANRKVKCPSARRPVSGAQPAHRRVLLGSIPATAHLPAARAGPAPLVAHPARSATRCGNARPAGHPGPLRPEIAIDFGLRYGRPRRARHLPRSRKPLLPRSAMLASIAFRTRRPSTRPPTRTAIPAISRPTTSTSPTASGNGTRYGNLACRWA